MSKIITAKAATLIKDGSARGNRCNGFGRMAKK